MSLSPRRELVPTSIRHAAVTTALVLGAPLFIAALAVAGVSIPDNLRSPLMDAGLLTRDANEALESDRPAETPAAGRTRTAPGETVAGGRPRGGERGSTERPASDESRGGGAGTEPSGPAPTSGGESVRGSPALSELEEEPVTGHPPGGAPAGGQGGGAAAVPGVPAPVGDGLEQVDETVEQLDDALGDIPGGQTSDELPVGGTD